MLLTHGDPHLAIGGERKIFKEYYISQILYNAVSSRTGAEGGR
jgi:hypothetical protein